MTEDRPNKVPWPPLIYGAAAGAAWVLGRWVPLGFLPVLSLTGLTIIATGLGFDIAAMVTMVRHRANILPHRAATALVSTGPFAVSRNPIYLGNTLVLVGLAGALGNAWFLLAAVAAARLVTTLAILREEAHLAGRFGAAWDDYAARVPRWFGLPTNRHMGTSAIGGKDRK